MDAALSDWRLGAATCVGVHVIYTVNLYGSVLILAFISLDRYLAVVRATDTNTGGLRQLLAHKLVYVGESQFTHLLSVDLFSDSPLNVVSLLPPLRCMVARCSISSARFDICPNSGRRRRIHSVPAILPRKQRPTLGGHLPHPAGSGGSGDSWPGSPGVLLRYRHQANPRSTGGPEAETAGGQDHHSFSALLLCVLAPIWSRHLCGRSAAI